MRSLNFNWMTEGNCKPSIQHLFFPEKYNEETMFIPRMYCAACPVKQECLDYAMNNGNPQGVWAGTSHSQRERAIRKRNKERVKQQILA